jgi:hypothetical protein
VFGEMPARRAHPFQLVSDVCFVRAQRLGGLSYFAGAEKKDDRVLVPDLGSLTSIHDRWVVGRKNDNLAKLGPSFGGGCAFIKLDGSPLNSPITIYHPPYTCQRDFLNLIVGESDGSFQQDLYSC